MLNVLIALTLLSGILTIAARLYLKWCVHSKFPLSLQDFANEEAGAVAFAETYNRAQVSPNSRVSSALRIYVLARGVSILFFAVVVTTILYVNMV